MFAPVKANKKVSVPLFLNITTWLVKALQNRGKDSMVHIFTEINTTSSVHSAAYNVSFDAWREFSKSNNLKVHIDVNRYEMFHHFVTADIIINDVSGFSKIATWANLGLKLHLNSLSACNNISSLWNPCQGDDIKATATTNKYHDYHCGGIGVNMTEVEAILDKSFALE